MADSQAIALLADPNKVDLPKQEGQGQGESKSEGFGFSSKPAVETISRPPTPKPPVSSGGGGANVLDLLEETQDKPIFKSPAETMGESSSKPSGGADTLDLSDIQINDDKPEVVHLTPEQIREKKEKILYDIERLRRRGVRFPRSFTMASDLDEMEAEYNRIKKDLETEQGVRFQRKMLMTCVSGIEMLNNRFDPFDVQLDGWSESVNENIGDYDDVFEELYEKYRGTGKMAPELRLLFMLGGSALMFHMTKSMFSSATPQMADVLRNNPGLASQMQQAAAQQMGGGGLASMMGMAQSGVAQSSAAPPPPRGVAVPPPENVDDVLRDLQGPSRPKKSSRGGRSGGKSSTSIDTLSLSLQN